MVVTAGMATSRPEGCNRAPAFRLASDSLRMTVPLARPAVAGDRAATTSNVATLLAATWPQKLRWAERASPGGQEEAQGCKAGRATLVSAPACG